MNQHCPWCKSDKNHLHLELKDYFLTGETFQILECEQCHLLFTTPRPQPNEIGKYYKSENYYSHQENVHGFIPRLYEKIKAKNLKNKLQMATEGYEAGKILDIGCGVADFLRIAKTHGWSVTGIEPDEQAREIAEKRLHAHVLNPDDIGKLEDESFDVITMWHVLEHVADLHAELGDLFRLLKKGGRLVIALPNYQSYDANYYQAKWAAYDVPRHLSHFSKDTVQMIFSSIDVKLEKTEKLIWDAFYISYLSEKYKGRSLALLRGAYRGWISNRRAKKSGAYSSLVYIFKK